MEQTRDRRRDYLKRAVNPSLFSAALHPDLIMALTIANLLCPQLWELADRVRTRCRNQDGPDVRMKKLHQFVNHHFYHPAPEQVSRIWGLYERDMITDAAELSSSDRAMILIARAFDMVGREKLREAVVEYGVVPRYIYPTVDVMLAHGAMLKHVGKDCLGLTSCLDECVLIASLALALGWCGMDELAFVGSPFHYAVFLFPGGRGFLFNSKREFFSKEDWLERSGGQPDRSSRTFTEKLLVCDRIITPYGYCVFPGGPTTITSDRMEYEASRITGFLGSRPPEVAQAVTEAVSAHAGGQRGAECVDRAVPSGRGGIESVLLKEASNDYMEILEAALYAFRHPRVRDPELFGEAAMQGFKSYILSGLVAGLEDAREIADGVVGRESIYGDSSRLAMPDEVLFFNTANERERQLLIETLLRHSGLTGLK